MVVMLHTKLNGDLIIKNITHHLLRGHVGNVHFAQGANMKESQKQHSFVSFYVFILWLPPHACHLTEVYVELDSPCGHHNRTTHSITYNCSSWD
jgi:hypothetical protein